MENCSMSFRYCFERLPLILNLLPATGVFEGVASLRLNGEVVDGTSKQPCEGDKKASKINFLSRRQG